MFCRCEQFILPSIFKARVAAAATAAAATAAVAAAVDHAITLNGHNKQNRRRHERGDRNYMGDGGIWRWYLLSLNWCNLIIVKVGNSVLQSQYR